MSTILGLCEKCGDQLRPDSSFCTSCGCQIGKEKPEATTESTQQPAGAIHNAFNQAGQAVQGAYNNITNSGQTQQNTPPGQGPTPPQHQNTANGPQQFNSTQTFPGTQGVTHNYGAHVEQKSRLLCGLLAIFLGFGIHNFILGHTNRAILQLVLSIVGVVFTLGLLTTGIWIWCLIEGIFILTQKPGYDKDAQGIPLKE